MVKVNGASYHFVSVHCVSLHLSHAPSYRTDCSAAADEDSEGGTCGIPWPTITMDFHGRRSDYLIMNASSPWPLQINGDVDKWIQVGRMTHLRTFHWSTHSETHAR